MGILGLAVCGCYRANSLFVPSALQVNKQEKTYICSMKKAYRLMLILILTMSGMIISGKAVAQCPMCHIAAESNMQNGGTGGKGLNAGIFYMLALPYSLVATLGFIMWRNNRRKEEDEIEVLP